MNPQTKKVSWGLITIAVISFFGTCAYSTWKTQRYAERFYKDALRLELGKATADDVLKLAKSSHGKLLAFQPCLSGGGNCVGTVFFEDLWLHRLRLAPATAFGCRFTIQDYKLRNRWMEMESGASRVAFVNEGTSRDVYPAPVQLNPEQKDFRIIQDLPSGFIGVWMTPNTPADLRNLAYNFNFDCLVRVGGCKSVEQMLPILGRKDLYRGQSEPWLNEETPPKGNPGKT